jgi:small GTP-binding protein
MSRDHYESWMAMRTPGKDAEDVTNKEARLLFKVVMVGETGVGKTCLLERYRGKAFEGEGRSDATIGVDFYSRKLRVGVGIKEAHESAHGAVGSPAWLEEQPIIKMQIWDTAGHERFATITRSYFMGVAGCVIVYDATRPESARTLNKWLTAVRYYSPGVRCLVLANKCDKVGEEREAEEIGRAFAAGEGTMHMSLSASESSAEEIEVAFRGIATSVFRELVQPMIQRGEVERALTRVGGRISYTERLQGRILRESVHLDHGVTFYLVPWLDDVSIKSEDGGGYHCPSGCAIL